MEKIQDESLISREASTAIKGLLIFLIILGHNSFFSSESRIGMVYLYTFHIQAFFMLPFLYPHKKISATRLRDYAIRLYYPFVVLFLSLTLLNYVGNSLGIIPKSVSPQMIEMSNKWKDFLLTILTGNGYNIDYFTGFQFLWFLPVMFSMTILKDIYYDKNTSKVFKFLMILSGSIFFFIYFIFGFRTPFDKNIIYLLKEYSPFAVTYALGAFFMGVVGLWIIKMKNNRIAYIAIPMLFILGTVICLMSQHDGEIPINDEIRWVLLLTMPFLFFFILYQIRYTLSNSRLLQKLGKYSFPIYIIHPFLLKILFMIVYPLWGTNWGIVIISQIIITVISYHIARIIYKNPYLKAAMFPNSWNEIYKLKTKKV